MSNTLYVTFFTLLSINLINNSMSYEEITTAQNAYEMRQKNQYEAPATIMRHNKFNRALGNQLAKLRQETFSKKLCPKDAGKWMSLRQEDHQNSPKKNNEHSLMSKQQLTDNCKALKKAIAVANDQQLVYRKRQ